MGHSEEKYVATNDLKKMSISDNLSPSLTEIAKTIELAESIADCLFERRHRRINTNYRVQEVQHEAAG